MTYAEKETACAVHAGIESEHQFSKVKMGERIKYICNICGYNTFWPEDVKDTCALPIGHALVKELKAWCDGEGRVYQSTEFRVQWVMASNWSIINKKRYYTATIADEQDGVLGSCFSAVTEDEAFISAYYCAFCRKEKP